LAKHKNEASPDLHVLHDFIKHDPAAICGIDISFKMRAYLPFSVVAFWSYFNGYLPTYLYIDKSKIGGSLLYLRLSAPAALHLI